MTPKENALDTSKRLQASLHPVAVTEEDFNVFLRTEAAISFRHREMVKTLVKDPVGILASLTPEKVDLLHAAIGIMTEAGELLDAVKAHVIYGKPLDKENVLEEAGDSEFYWEALRKNQGFTRTQALEHNLAKLAKRYENFKYSDQAAQVRQDKQTTGETDNRVL